MKIGITCYPTYGGSGVVATELGIELAALGHEVHFIAYSQPFRLTGREHGILYHEVPVSNYPLFEYPPYDLALMTDWDAKVRKFAELGATEPITAISGIPAWMLVLFGKLKEVTGKKTVAEVWPDLRMVGLLTCVLVCWAIGAAGGSYLARRKHVAEQAGRNENW